MSTPDVFRINQPAVISEVIDGEAIIVNLDTGAYFSLRDTGCTIWSLIEEGASLSQVVEQMVRQYDGGADVIEAGVQAFCAELQAENLIVAHNGPAQTLAQPPAGGERPRFRAPLLEKYTDMADLLLLDPIHEVDELGGWPHPAPANNR